MCNENPLISVIVPVYKVEKYLRRCLDSILTQTYHNLEIILVDDGSPDRSGEICDEYAAKDSRIRVIHRENGGLSAARNTGLDICTGDYIAFVDSDDYIGADMLQRLLAAIGDADLCGCGTIRENQEGMTISETKVAEICVLPGQKILYQHYLGQNGSLGITEVSVWGKLYRRRIFHDLRFREGVNFEDIHLMPFLLNRCEKVCFLPYAGYHYLITPDSITTSTDEAHLKKCYEDCFLIWKDHEALYCDMGSDVLLRELYCVMIDKLITHMLREKVPRGCEDWSQELLRRTVAKVMVRPIGAKRKVRYVIFSILGIRGYKLLRRLLHSYWRD